MTGPGLKNGRGDGSLPVPLRQGPFPGAAKSGLFPIWLWLSRSPIVAEGITDKEACFVSLRSQCSEPRAGQEPWSTEHH